MSDREYWMANAEYIWWDEQDQWILGEDEHGAWWVPYAPTDMRPYWVRFSKWNPLHWACYWRSRLRNRVVFLEWAGEFDD